tara:strand:+ start:436 stop:558 length:123 start_codon:yes stop_codon:yes gene_type:complete
LELVLKDELRKIGIEKISLLFCRKNPQKIKIIYEKDYKER